MSSDERLSELHVENFRCFKEYYVSSFGDVNLFIGKNNSGKTTLLEAVEFSYQPHVNFFASCSRRKEFMIQEKNKKIDHKCLFYDKNQFNCRLSVNRNVIFVDGNKISFKDIYLENFIGSSFDFFKFIDIYDIWIDNIQKNKMIPMVLETDLFKVDWLYRVWNTIVGNESEDYVIEMMKIIEPSLERIVFTSGEDQPTPFVKLKGMKERVHLGYLGEGARRLFVLAMFCAKSANSVLLVDEIDLGFHYSIMSRLWSTLMEWSKKYNIQIFATTHSQDCLHALYKLVKHDQTSGCDVKVLRIDKSQTQPTVYEPEDLIESVGEGIEIR